MKIKATCILVVFLYLLASILIGCSTKSSNINSRINTNHLQVTYSLQLADEAEKAASPFLTKPASQAKR